MWTSTSCPGSGPVVAKPVATLADVAAIPDLTPEHVPFITEAVQRLVGELGATPLIGFAGAPFTVASYLVEGGPSKEHAKTKAMMFGAPEVWDALMRKIAGISAAYLQVQVDAGASAVQLFDSWAGAMAPADYRRYVMPYSSEVLAHAGTLGVPRIHFGVGTGELLGLMGEAGADVVGVDWRVPLDEGVRRVGGRVVQGNLDPSLVFAPTEVMLERAADVLERGPLGAGPHLQPRARRDALHRPRPARAAHRLRPRALGPLTDRLRPAQSRSAGSAGPAGTAVAVRRRAVLRTSSHTGTPTSASTTAKGSTAPTTVSDTTTASSRASQPLRSPARKPASSRGPGGATDLLRERQGQR